MSFRNGDDDDTTVTERAYVTKVHCLLEPLSPAVWSKQKKRKKERKKEKRKKEKEKEIDKKKKKKKKKERKKERKIILKNRPQNT